jgi:release factor glutamine methyltransferase
MTKTVQRIQVHRDDTDGQMRLPHTLPPVLRWVRRVQHAFVYHLWVKPAISRVDTFPMLGFVLSVPPSVFHPKFYRTSAFFARYLDTVEFSAMDVLDIGSGSGILGLVAARKGASVTAVDINAKAVECTRANAARNGLGARVSAGESDLFDRVSAGKRFDRIIWSPPFYPVSPSGMAEYAWNAGPGYASIARFARSARTYLRPTGAILLLLSTEVDVPTILAFFQEERFEASVVAKKRLPFETLTVYRLEAS